MNTLTRLSALVLLITALNIASAIPVLSHGSARSPSVISRYAYMVSSSGRWIRMDTQRHEIVSEGSIWQGSWAEKICPLALTRVKGCLLWAGLYDPGTSLFYTLVSEEVLDFEGEHHYWIVAHQLPNFDVVRSARLPVPATPVSSPSWLLNSDKKEVTVNYFRDEMSDDGERLYSVMARYNVPDLQPLETVRYPSQDLETVPHFYSTNPHLTRGGMIVDRGRVLDQEGRELELVTGLTVSFLLTNDLKQKLRRLELPTLKGEGTYLPIQFADSEAGRMLFMITADSPARTAGAGSGLLVYDVESKAILSAIVTPYRASSKDGGSTAPTAHLSPDGNLVVSENYEWRDVREPHGRAAFAKRFKTGELTFYDADTGRIRQEMQLNPPPGFYGRVVGFSPGNELMYYASDHIYAVDLTETQEVQARAIEEKFSPKWLFFSDR